ncbi:septal ring lytic transglycosylase RlpA family protein [Helicobacter didelphidarum]|uniref:Probable endolytic peptidoglycan transglycosylase RlpA n=1 Tax=Helicobacter didelphidarum TaxID=2040648 RepID=A0A3D8IMJ4_9HELI|nr:septal ring lytic transglycosylase RlpA family protein [Helicobacter didelphidarum]RDU66136.1 septal ring lytic transglycosylase RlpA family protein [Helicobacter didelphidarum]
MKNPNTNKQNTSNTKKQKNYEPPVKGSSKFTPTQSLLGGMRDSEAIQRATMKSYTVRGKTYHPHAVKVGDTFDGIASWYGPDFHAKSTSNGETYNMHAHTAANKTLPMNTIVKVFNKDNGKTTIVRINDRGPFVEGRIIDLSNIAAHDIAMVSKGIANVRIEVIGFGGNLVHDKQSNNSPSSVKRTENIESKNTQQTPTKTQSLQTNNAQDSKDSTAPINKNIITSNENQPLLNEKNLQQLKDSNQNNEQKSQNNKKQESLRNSLIEEELPEDNYTKTQQEKKPETIIKSSVINTTQEQSQDIEQTAKQIPQQIDAKSNNKDIDETLQKLRDSTQELQYTQEKLDNIVEYATQNKQINQQQNITHNNIAKESTPINIVADEESLKQPTQISNKTHMVSLNVFSQKERAENYLKEVMNMQNLQNVINTSSDSGKYNIEIIPTDKGLYRVALRGFRSYDEAKTFINEHNINGHIVKE